MKILIVSQYFCPENFRINDLAFALHNEKEHEVTVLTGLPNYPEGRFFKGYGFWGKYQETISGVRVFRVPLLPRGDSSKWRMVLNYLSFAFSASLFGPFVCRGRYDIILVAQYSPVTVGLPAILLKKIKNAPILIWVQDLWPESLSATGAIKSKTILDMVNTIVRFIFHNSDRILVQSKAFISPIQARMNQSTKIDYLPNWAERLYCPTNPEIEWGLENGLPQGFRIMFAGNIGFAQDFETILDAADIVKFQKDIHWVILGDGRARSWVEQEIVKRGLSSTVHLLGRFPIEDMPAFFSLADAMLVTLKKDPIFSLTIPGKIQSYMACGCPIIAALDGEGQRIVIEAGAGFGCPAGNPAELAALVLKIYDMSIDERQKLGQSARAYYNEHFAREVLIDRLDNWFKEVVDYG